MPYQLDKQQLAFFDEHGYLVVEGLLRDEDLEALEREYEQKLNDVADTLHRRGFIPSTFAGLGFAERFVQVLARYPALHTRFNISLPLSNREIDAETFYVYTGPAVFELLRNPRILDVVESVIGAEIYSSPVQQMRMKPPMHGLTRENAVHSNVGKTVWHQDMAALLPEADDTEQLTVWVAVTPATTENGCLLVVPGSFRGGRATHCANRRLAVEPYIPGVEVDGGCAVPLPVARGGIVLLHKLTMHGALPNLSADLRWSLDIRYHPSSQASGRPAFPGFVARSRANPASELSNAAEWAQSWETAKAKILNGDYQRKMFEDSRWNDPAVC